MSVCETSNRLPGRVEWEECTLHDLLKSPIRTGLSKTGRPDSDKRCLTLSAVRGRTLSLDASKPVEASDSEAAGNWVRPGCFYVVRGNGNRELVGRGAFAPESLPHPVLFPDLLFQLDLDERVDPDFFWCLWSSSQVRREIEERARTAAGIYKINTANLNSLPLRLPHRTEQKRIAAELTAAMSAVDRARRAAKERLAAAEALPAAYLREVFEGPDAGEWERVRLGDICETCSGATPSRNHPEEETVTAAALRDCSLPLLPPGTLLVAMYGQGQTRGRTGLLACKATTNQACFAILPKEDTFEPAFLQLWFRANYVRLRALTENRGGNQPNLNGVLLRQLEVALPLVAEQRRLASELDACLEAAAVLAAKCQEELAAIEALPAALLREAFGSPDLVPATR